MRDAKHSPSNVALPPLDDLLASLVTPQRIFFPIRHHSPTCAAFIEALINEWRPTSVLVEGPAEMTKLIPLLLDPRAKPPFAIYTSFQLETEGAETSRSAAYYPFADYSPELVALRGGAAVQAGLRFIDLNYPEQKAAAPPGEERPEQTDSLLEERYYRRSEYLRALARRAGCRDHNELWEHLFETRLPVASGNLARPKIEQFIRDVAAWCYFSRVDSAEAELEADGTLARESAMAAAIRSNSSDRILVITGGFHTVVLPRLLREKAPRKKSEKPRLKSSTTCLVRYSFDQLDSLNGYSAGMPSPYFYQQLWKTKSSEKSGVFHASATKILVEIGQRTRRKDLVGALSAADEIAALAQAETLARVRGHAGPIREDILDGIRSCFVKGAIDAEGELLLGLAREIMAGKSIGEVPPGSGTPPLVQDFQTRCGELRLNISDSAKRKTSLDLYRRQSHRKISRFFHSLTFLNIPFARLAGGPDFVRGTALDRLHEHWEYQWTPRTESQLIEANIHGDSIDQAAAALLRKNIAELQVLGRSRNSAEGVSFLIQACRMGLHGETRELIPLISQQIAQDPDFVQTVSAVEQLILLWRSREPLEAHRLEAIPALIKAAHQRVCFLIPGLAPANAEIAEKALPALLLYRDLAMSCTRSKSDAVLDISLFWNGVEYLLTKPACPPLLVGAAAGMLHWIGRLPNAKLLSLVRGYLNGALARANTQTAFLVGLLKASRELAWREPALTREIQQLLDAWTEHEFIQRLPDLRLAFADLSPRETDLVAAQVAKGGGLENLGPLRSSSLTEEEMLAFVEANLAVRKGLEADGLLEWALGPEGVAKP